MSFYVSDCSEEKAAEGLFVNTNDNITFNINKLIIGGGRKFYMYHNGKEVGMLYLFKYRLNYTQMVYDNRTLFHSVRWDSNQTDWYITISGAKRSDNGTYLFVDVGKRLYYVCFVVFVYGKFCRTFISNIRVCTNNVTAQK